MIYECFYKFPDSRLVGLPWCNKIVEALHDWELDDLVNLLSNMIVIDPQGRMSARECWQGALELDCPTGRSTPKPTTSQRRDATTKIYADETIHRPSKKTSQATWLAVSITNSSKRRRSPNGDLGNIRRYPETFLDPASNPRRPLRSGSREASAKHPGHISGLGDLGVPLSHRVEPANSTWN